MTSVGLSVTSVLLLCVSHLTVHAQTLSQDMRFLVFLKAPASCAGTIISPSWVLTAANRCIHNSTFAEDYWMVAGTPDHFQERQGDTLHIHPNRTNDVALIKVTHKWNIGQFVRVIRMLFGSLPRFPTLSNACFAAGWNRTPQGADANKKTPLQSAYLLTTVQSEQCGLKMNRTVPENNVCAQDQFGSWDLSEKNIGGYPCAGDVGGPLVCDIFTEDGRLNPMMTGVMSSYEVLLVDGGVEVCRLVFYAETGSLLPWIRTFVPDIETQGLEEPMTARVMDVQDEESSTATAIYNRYNSLQVMVLGCSGATVITDYGKPATRLISMVLAMLIFMRVATLVMLFLNFFGNRRLWRRFSYIVCI